MPVIPQESIRRAIGSTSITPSPRISNPVQADWYGAVGDDVADDYAALLAAATAAGPGGSVVLTPGKTYRTTQNLTVPYDNMTFWGYGATVTSATAAQWGKFNCTGRTGVQFIGIKFNCLYATVAGQSYATIDINASSSILIRDCYLNDTPMGVRVVGACSRVAILNNRFYKNFCAIGGDDDGAGNQPAWVTISGNSIRTGLGTTSTNFSGGIKVSGIAGDVFLTICNNQIDATGQMGIEVQGPDQFIISGNNVYNVAFGISVSESDYAAIEGNTVKTCSFVGIEVASNSTNISIAGNVVRVGAVSAIAVSSNSSGIIISGNRLHSTTRTISLQEPGKVQITGNYLSGSANVYCQNASDVSISGNTFAGDGVNTFSALVVDATDLDVSGVNFTGNRVLGGYLNSIIYLYTPNAPRLISDMLITDNNVKGCNCPAFTINTSVPNVANNIKRVRCYNNIGDGTNDFTRNLSMPWWDVGIAQTWPYGVYINIEGGLVNVDATAGAAVFPLPHPGTVGSGYKLSVRKADVSVNTVTVTTPGGVIVGTTVLSTNNKIVNYLTNGSDWVAVSEN